MEASKKKRLMKSQVKSIFKAMVATMMATIDINQPEFYENKHLEASQQIIEI